jgi:hypothetical protein
MTLVDQWRKQRQRLPVYSHNLRKASRTNRSLDFVCDGLGGVTDRWKGIMKTTIYGVMNFRSEVEQICCQDSKRALGIAKVNEPGPNTALSQLKRRSLQTHVD